MNTIFATAVAASAAGIRVLPVAKPTIAGVCQCFKGAACEHPGKHPILGN